MKQKNEHVVLSKVWFCMSKFKAMVRLRDVPFGREDFKARGQGLVTRGQV